MIRSVWGLYLLLVLSSFSFASSKADEYEKEKLEREVAKIMRQSNVNIRKNVDKIFALGDIHNEEKDCTAALYFYIEGLKTHAWNLDYQLKAAVLLHEKNRDDEAVEKGRLVYDYAEKEKLIEQAEKLLEDLGQSVPKDTPSEPGSPIAISLVCLGDVNEYLLKEVIEDLQKTLGVHYFLDNSTKLDLGKVDRPYSKRYMKAVYDDISNELSDEDFKTYRVKSKTSITDLEQYESQKKFVCVFLKDLLPPKEYQKFSDVLFEQEQKGQYNAGRLTSMVRLDVKKDRNIDAYIGVTSEDIYDDDYNFLFGQAGLEYGVMSYHRFTAAFNESTPSRKKLKNRTARQLISSSFLVLGIPRCSNPTCARAYPNSLEEHDHKENEPCVGCLKKWEERVGRLEKSKELLMKHYKRQQ